MARARRSAAVKDDGRFWEDDAIELPRAGTPDAEEQQRRFKAVRRMLKASLWGSLVVIVLAALAVMASLRTEADVPDSYTSDTRALAEVSLTTWLRSDPAPLPGGWVVGWESSTTPPPRTPDSTNEVPATITVHRFTVADSNGSLYAAQVAVSSHPTSGSVVIGTPSLIPIPPSADQSGSDTSWGDLPSTSVTDGMKTGVQVWAEALLSGDPAKLRQAVGDPDASRSYTPLTGATLVSVSVAEAAARWGDPNGDHDGALPPEAVARVSIRYLWGAPSSSTMSRTAEMEFDVLLLAADTASPRVVAWGGVGTGQLLEEYGNAVGGRQVAAMPTPAIPTPVQTGPAQTGPAQTSPAAPMPETNATTPAQTAPDGEPDGAQPAGTDEADVDNNEYE